MADEITITAGMRVSNGELEFELSPRTRTYDQDNLGGPEPGMVVIGDVEETLTFDELGNEGWFMMKNLASPELSPGAFVSWGFSTGVYGGELGPGETAGPFKLKPGVTFYLLAASDGTKVHFWAFEK